jgi:hypothetical protein
MKDGDRLLWVVLRRQGDQAVCGKAFVCLAAV